jgi:hypothetical protein
MDSLIDLAIQFIGVPLVLSALFWLAAKIPGSPLKAWLDAQDAKTRDANIALVMGALARFALARVGVSTGPLTSVGVVATAADAVRYVKANLPETVATLAPSEDALLTMARAAVVQVTK